MLCLTKLEKETLIMVFKTEEIYNLPRGAVRGIVPGGRVITLETMKSKEASFETAKQKDQGRDF